MFQEAFSPGCDPTRAVHPSRMVERAFDVYRERPLLGEPMTKGRIKWWSYEQCGAAAASFGRHLRDSCGGDGVRDSTAVVICAGNSVGWLIADWACALEGIPSITIDAPDASARVLSTVREAADRQGCTVRAIIVDAHRVLQWRQLLGGTESPHTPPPPAAAAVGPASNVTVFSALRSLLDRVINPKIVMDLSIRN